MSDLISRRAVKEWLTRWEGYIDKDIIARMQCRVVDIPSARPVLRTEMSSADLISRQAALDAFYKYPNIAWTTLDVLAEITVLPSAQPEIVRCHECKWFGRIGCAISIVDDSDKPTENDFCSFAERKGENDEPMD